MAAIAFDYNAFIAAFPAFQATPEAALEIYWDTATVYVSDTLPPAQFVKRQTTYLMFMTAHLAALNAVVATGETPGVLVGATIDKVTVQLQPPPEKSQFQWWLNQTPYGQQLLALLQIQTVGGFYVGGAPEASAFRKVRGIF